MKLRPIKVSHLLLGLIPLVILLVGAGVWFALPRLQTLTLPWSSEDLPVATRVSIAAATATSTPSLTPLPPTATSTQATAAPVLVVASGSPDDHLNQEGLMVLAMRDGLYIHLFAYNPLYLPPTRLTNTPWDDITPSLSPDGTKLAFSSRRNGYFDLFLLDLTTGQFTRLTDTADFEASPTWSPDGKWLAYEKFDGGNQDVYLLSLEDPKAETVRLTDSGGQNQSPAWSPSGRQIAFVSNRSGDEEIWLADLDKVDNRFTNISRDTLSRDLRPAWASDGKRLTWSSERNGNHRLATWEASGQSVPKRTNMIGDLPAWSPDGNILFAEITGPNQQDLTAYDPLDGRMVLPTKSLPGKVYGMTWVHGPLPAWLSQEIHRGDQSPAPVLSKPVLDHLPSAPAGRMSVVPLEDITAPQPRLHDAVDEAFRDLRKQVGMDTGWDALSSLENAFIPVTTPNDPAIQDDWLYTGRAFALNPLLLSAGWMTIVREDFEGQTYWRIFLKARYQDGSMGFPIGEMTWDLNARYSGNPHSYEQGGKLIQPPPGYWIDLTELASRFGWERLPSQTDWRTYYPSIRFNQFVITSGLDWYSAMAEIYPREALVTLTPQPTYTSTITVTPETPFPTDTATPTITPVPTRRPTLTPLPNSAP